MGWIGPLEVVSLSAVYDKGRNKAKVLDDPPLK